MVKPTELWNRNESPVRTGGSATCGAHRRGGRGGTSGSAVRGSSHSPSSSPPPPSPTPRDRGRSPKAPQRRPVLTCTMVRGFTDSVGKLPRPWMGTVSPKIWSNRCTCSHVSTLKRSPVRCSEQPAASAASIAPPAAPPGSDAENSRKYRAGGGGGDGGEEGKKKRKTKKKLSRCRAGGAAGGGGPRGALQGTVPRRCAPARRRLRSALRSPAPRRLFI